MKIQHIKMRFAMKAVLTGKFIALNVYTEKEERIQSSDLTSYLKKPEESKLTASKRKETIMSRN